MLPYISARLNILRRERSYARAIVMATRGAARGETRVEKKSLFDDI